MLIVQPPTFEERLSMARKLRGLTIADLARATGLHRNYLASLEEGKSSPTIGKLRLLATALDVSCAQLLGEADLFEVTHGQ